MCFLRFKNLKVIFLCIAICCMICIFVSMFIGNTKGDDEYSLCNVAKALLQQKGIFDFNINQINCSNISYDEKSNENQDKFIEEYINGYAEQAEGLGLHILGENLYHGNLDFYSI